MKTTDKYQRDMHSALTLAYHNGDVKTALALIDRIYEDGFTDGVNESPL